MTLLEPLARLLGAWGWRRNGFVALVLSRRVGLPLSELEGGWSLVKSMRSLRIEEPLRHLERAVRSPIRPDGVYVLAEAAHYLGVERERLGVWVRRGHLPSTVSEGFTWFRGSDLLRMLARQSLAYLDALSVIRELEPGEAGAGPRQDQR